MALPTDDPIVQRWTAIGAGLVIGLGAKYAIMIQDRSTITWRDLVVDVLLLAANALMASIMLTRLGWQGQEAIALAALFGASSDRIVRIVRKRFEAKARAYIGETAVVDVSGSKATAHIVRHERPQGAPLEILGDELLAKVRALPGGDLEALIERLNTVRGTGEAD